MKFAGVLFFLISVQAHGQENVAPPATAPYTQSKNDSNNSRELALRMANRIKDPFMLPNSLFFKIKKKLGDVKGEGYVDESVSPQLRWSLKHYALVAIIWNVKTPKAMINDLKGNIHMFKVNDRIGNGEGTIISIKNGEVIVQEKEIETKLRLNK